MAYADRHPSLPAVSLILRTSLAFSPWQVPYLCGRVARGVPGVRRSGSAQIYPEDDAQRHEYQGDPTSCCMVPLSTPTRIIFWMIAETPTSTRRFRLTRWYLR